MERDECETGMCADKDPICDPVIKGQMSNVGFEPTDGMGMKKGAGAGLNSSMVRQKQVYSGRPAALQTSKPCLIRYYQGRIPTY